MITAVDTLSLNHFDSAESLRREADAWDDLWLRSDVNVPRARAALVAAWLDHFRGGDRFHGLAVAEGGRLVAALPLVTRRVKGMLRIGALPCNDWACCGDLLLDPQADVDRALDRLVGELKCWPSRLLWFEQVPYDTPRWQAFLAACRRAGLSVHTSQQYEVGQVDIAGDWESYEATRKGDHRRSRRRYARMLDKEGRTELKSYGALAADRVDELLVRGFEVEDRSWKAAEGSSVCKAADMLEYYRREARQLAEWGQLELVFLELDGKPIAFEYGWNCKGVHFTPKVGFDAAYRKFGPGQQLRMRHFEQLFAQQNCQTLDFYGPLADWSASWTTHTYPVGRVVVAAAGMLNRRLLGTYASWQPRLRRLRRRIRRGRQAVGAATDR